MGDGLRDQLRQARDELRREGVSWNPWTSAKVLWRALLREHATPGRLAAAVAVGVFVGSLPIYPHLLWVLLLAIPLRLNKLIAALATNISNPLFAPFLIFAEIQVGVLLRTGHFSVLTIAELRALGLVEVVRSYFVDAVVGALLVGGVAAIVSGLLVRAALTRRQRRRAEG